MIDFNAELSISRVQSNAESQYIEIKVDDDDARERIVTLKVSLEAFTQAITGLHGVKAVGAFTECPGFIGKLKVNEEYSFEMEDYGFSARKDQAKAAIAHLNAQNDGWIYSDYLSSQNSIKSKADKTVVVNTNRYKWVDK